MVLLLINKKHFADGKIRYAHFLAYAEHQDSIFLIAALLPERKLAPFLNLRHIQACALLLLMQAVFATLLSPTKHHDDNRSNECIDPTAFFLNNHQDDDKKKFAPSKYGNGI